MTKLDAIAVVEIKGLPAAVDFADVALKSANIRLIGYELAKGGGLVGVKICGRVDAVKAAVDAGRASAEKVSGAPAFFTIIPRPSDGANSMILSKETVGLAASDDIVKMPQQENNPLYEVELSESQEIEATLQIDDATKNECCSDLIEKSEMAEDVGANFEQEDESHSIARAPGVNSALDASSTVEAVAESADSDSDPTCNICGDPKCPRHKGEPRRACIHANAGKRK
jgi:microcompartment protein CcmL/EutN